MADVKESSESSVVASGAATLLPAGTLPTIPLELGSHHMSIELVTNDEIPEALVVYPDGFKKFHQVHDITDLAGKIGGTLKGRYGVEAWQFLSCPKDVRVADMEIIIEGNKDDGE